MNKIKFNEVYEKKIIGYDNICPEAYSGCSGARDKGKFESKCIGGMNRYIERGSCGDVCDLLSPLLAEGGFK